MKRNEIFKLIAFPVIVLLVLSMLSTSNVPTENYSIGDEDLDKVLFDLLKEDKNTLDVLVLGDSLTYSGVSPYHLWNEYGYTSFVCGTPSQMINNTYEMLEAALLKQKPKVVLLETNVIYKATQQSSLVQSLFFQTFPILRYHNNWKGVKTTDNGKTIGQTRYKGYVLRLGHKKADTSKYMKPSSGVQGVSAVNKYYFEKIHSLCEENNIELILVSVPSIRYWDYAKHNGVTEFAEEYGVKYWDFNIDKELEIDWNKDTPDKGGHLNLYGAKKLTSRIGEMLSLQTDVELADHRGDANSDVWNQGWEELKKKIK
jgi:hypothetical protein